MGSSLNIDILFSILPHLAAQELITIMYTCRAIYPHVLPYIYANIDVKVYPILAQWGGWPRLLMSLKDNRAALRIKHIQSLAVDLELGQGYDYLAERSGLLHNFTNLLSCTSSLVSLTLENPCDAMADFVHAIATGCPALRRLTVIDIWQEQVHHLSRIPWPLTFLNLYLCPNDSSIADEHALPILGFFVPFMHSLKELRLGFSVLYPYHLEGFLETSADDTIVFPSLNTLRFKDCYPFEAERIIGPFPALRELSYRGKKQTLPNWRSR
jgi:hypothetical protein